MAEYRISGIWKDDNNAITHYAIHTKGKHSMSRAEKYTKSEAVALLEKPSNTATTWVWSYERSIWSTGEQVHIVNGSNGKYLRSDPDNTLTDNLGHLIDYDWIAPK